MKSVLIVTITSDIRKEISCCYNKPLTCVQSGLIATINLLLTQKLLLVAYTKQGQVYVVAYCSRQLGSLSRSVRRLLL